MPRHAAAPFIHTALYYLLELLMLYITYHLHIIFYFRYCRFHYFLRHAIDDIYYYFRLRCFTLTLLRFER